ncbi:MAG: hypothetical protein R3D51_04975 [Hyphomicrobiaceae bacterium]
MSNNKNDSGQSKRPHATLDLKATEVKVSRIDETAAKSKGSADQSASAGAASAAPAINPADVPMPAPARTYAGVEPAPAAAKTTASETSKTSPRQVGEKPADTRPSANASATISARPEAVVVQKRGGFLSHLAASVIGGAVALGAWTYGLPELQKQGLAPSGTSASGEAAEQSAQKADDLATKLADTQARLAALEKSTASIAELKDSQSRLVAETKAALAASASDAGAPDQIERLTTVENKLKAMADAGANDPSAGRVEQIAALTGKVADLETSMATQLTALRKSVSGDVEARVVAATEAAEAAKSGTQRVDRDLANLKTQSVKTDEDVAAIRAEVERSVEATKRATQEIANLKTAIDDVRSTSAKPADVASALSPVTAKIASIEQNLKAVEQADATRRSNAERVVLALELQNLKRTLDRGQNYEDELAEVEKAAAGKFDLAALEKFKDQGVPTMADLNRDFRTSANAMIDAEDGVQSDSVVDKLISGARSIVRVRKINHDSSDTSAEAVAGRMEQSLKEGQLAAVLNEADSLSPKAKEAAQPFLDKVRARATVDSALASLEDQLKSSLSGAPSQPATKTQ